MITVRDARTEARTGERPQIEEIPRDAVLSVEGLYKTYGPFVAVDHISFSVHPGETFGKLSGKPGQGQEIINRGGGVSDVWISWLILLAWATAGYLIAIHLFRWQ